MHLIEVSHYPVSLPKTMTVSVTDHERKPLADAEVVLAGTDGGVFTPAYYTSLKIEGKTDQNGKVVLQLPDEWFEGKISYVSLHVNSSKYTHSIDGRGWGRTKQGEAVIIPEEIAFEFEGNLITFQFVDGDGKPVAEGVKIHQDTPYPQVSDSKGALTFGPLPVQRSDQTFRVLHPDFQNQIITLTQADQHKIVTLQSGSEIFGKVVDDQGQAVAGANVFASGEKRITDQETITDENGRYHLKGLFPSDQILLIEKDGKRLHVQTLPLPERVTENNVTLQKANPVRIKVVTEDGKPLQGVNVKPRYTLELGKFSYEYPMARIAFEGSAGEPIANKTHYTDENGIWEWHNVPADADTTIEFHVHARHAQKPKNGLAYSVPGVHHFKPQEEPHVITAKLGKDEYNFFPINFTTWKDSKVLKVRVLDENLKPLAGALVEPCSEYGDSYGHFIRVDKPFPTDDNGIVIFDFSKTDVSDIQDFWIKVAAKGYRESDYFHIIGFESTAHSRSSYKTLPDEVEIILSPEGKLVGLVKDEAGKPVQGATVTVAQSFYSRSAPPVVTDKNGKWIADVPFPLVTKEQTHLTKIHVNKEGYLDSEIWFRGGFVKNTLRKATVLSFRVVNDKGQPLEGVGIQSLQSSIQPLASGTGSTNADGRLRVSVVPNEKSTSTEILLKKEGWTSRWIVVDLNQNKENLQWTLKPGKDVRVHFSFEGEEELPVIDGVSAYSTDPLIKDAHRWKIKNWQGRISRDEEGAILLKDAPDCEAYYNFFVPISLTHSRGSRGYGTIITPNTDGQVIRVVVERYVDHRENLWDNPNNYGLATPYGVISYRITVY
ncbi:MAG: carboxypeptidase regulatory-like domain-containing protein [Planctomycetaceae bacterium]|nr:carboxypeptidase regulatory-like domain-containing protein [Planctomycetaceae bacterium]